MSSPPTFVGGGFYFALWRFAQYPFDRTFINSDIRQNLGLLREIFEILQILLANDGEM